MIKEKNKIKILVVDDHKIIRDGIMALLQRVTEFDIVGEAENGQIALTLVGRINPDIVIMDINMPIMDGIEATKQITEKHPDVKVLVLTMTNEQEHIKNMIDAGARGYILKNSGEEELVSAITTILDGGNYFSDEVKDAIMQNMVQRKTKNEKISGEPIPLTRREKDVLNLIVHEFTNYEIADKLFISVRTVDAHRRNLLEKTGARNTAGLVKFAIGNQLFTP
ncbi:MAG: response regulator transcription factor [Bacteroidales bacterium]|nr:response regulator transcription factor [Bacteroidales bacterium]